VRIRRAYPDVEDLELVYALAALAKRGGDYLERVQLFLAYAPWRDDAAALIDAVLDNRLTWDVALLGGYEQQVAIAAEHRRRAEKGTSNEQR